MNSWLQHVGSSSPTRDGTQASWTGSAESQPLDQQGSPMVFDCWKLSSLIYPSFPLAWYLSKSGDPSWCACVLSRFSHVRLFVTPWTVARQAPLSMGFSRQEYWSGLPCPSPGLSWHHWEFQTMKGPASPPPTHKYPLHLHPLTTINTWSHPPPPHCYFALNWTSTIHLGESSKEIVVPLLKDGGMDA